MFRLIWWTAGRRRPWPGFVSSQPARPRPGEKCVWTEPQLCVHVVAHMDMRTALVCTLNMCSVWHQLILNICLVVSAAICMHPSQHFFWSLSLASCLCERSCRPRWPQVSGRLCRGNCWKWRGCTARSAPATPSSRPWSAGSAACSDSPKAETAAHRKHTPRLWFPPFF